MSEITPTRPLPPPEVLEPGADLFVPSRDLEDWLRSTFIDDKGPLANPDHQHLQMARIGVLWAAAPMRRKMRHVAGTAEIPMPPAAASAWQRGRWAQQIRELWPWHAQVDFILTFHGPTAAELDDVSWCALVEHELYHCAQAEDEWDMPKFRRDGTPLWGIKGHDAEEFVGPVERYGLGAAAGGVAALVAAGAKEPTIAAAKIHAACGVCLRAA